MGKAFRWGIAMTAVVAVSVLAVQVADAQRQGGGGRGGGARLVADVEGLWAMATFDAKLDDATLAKLKPVCQKAYDERKTALAASPPDREKLMAIGDALATESKAALGDQADKVKEWYDQRAAMVERINQGGPGGGPGGPGGGGGGGAQGGGGDGPRRPAAPPAAPAPGN